MAEQAQLLPGTLDLLILKAVSLGPLHGQSADHRGRVDQARTADPGDVAERHDDRSRLRRDRTDQRLDR